MNLKINSIGFPKTRTQSYSLISMKGRYTGIPNFNPHYELNSKQGFFTKVIKFFKALYYANFK